ncbi:MAG TPA: 2-C-methyl-D-erythritol 4-phosphate cytidylyltransferase [Firmicutes bacterium]|nr:2-C-methyl-D-erythritol 4-phosphate cytidylyltransferase [Bacillota bacterium]
MISVILAGGGRGERTGRKIPKSFIKINKKYLFLYSLEKFNSLSQVKEIILVLPEEKITDYLKNKLKKEFSKLKIIVGGGRERKDSVYNGLKYVDEKADIVLIHDVARPFVSRRLIERVIDGAKKYKACIPVIPSTDTLKIVENNFVKKTIEREKVFRVQTPQGFSKDVILKAYNKSKNINASDDSQLVENIGIRVYTVEGEMENIKITFPVDIEIAKKLKNG